MLSVSSYCKNTRLTEASYNNRFLSMYKKVKILLPSTPKFSGARHTVFKQVISDTLSDLSGGVELSAFGSTC